MNQGTRRSPRRILFATADSNWAGAQSQMLELAAGLDRSEFEPVVLTAGSGGLVERSRAAHIPTHVVPLGFLRRRFPFLPYYAVGPVALRAMLNRERIALVHTHCPNSAMPIMNAARGRALSLVAHVHDFDQRWVTSRTLRVQNRITSTVVAISDAGSDYLVSRGVDRARVRRIYNGIHLPPPPPDARTSAREKLGIADAEIAILLVGRLVRRKGAADLLHSLADPRLAGLPVRLYLVGGIEESERTFPDELRRLAAELQLTPRVVFVGERDDAATLHAGCDIAAVPARREAFGRVIVEAMHAGAPIVAYRDAAIPELARDDVEALLVPPGNTAAMAHAIHRLATDAALRARLGAAGRERARAFDHGRFVREVSALYRELLHQPSNG